MSLKFLIVFFLCVGTAISGISFRERPGEAEALFHQQVGSFIEKLEKLNEAAGRNDAQENLKQLFLDTRLAYKRSSVMVDYFFPIQRKVVNGPDLRYAEDDNPDAIHDPHGFQVIERIVYDDEINYTDLKNEISSLLQTLKSIDGQPGLDYKLRSDLLFDAMKGAVIRMVSLDVTGFDSPIALNSLEESEGVLEGIAEILKIYRDDAGTDLASKAKQNLKSATNFDSFDRLRFMKNFADPLYSHLVNMVVAKRYELPVERRPINQFATSIFSDTLFNIHFF
ncbi:MAG: hypothetical protein JNK79_11425, partial [Chitinophagaceae bacterium]|nr:hypothetical protein [Chitinophagaceae bacterium]